MISILVADDDERKAERIESTIRALVEGANDLRLKTARTVSEARVELSRDVYDLLILDLNMPLREGEAPRRDGGLRLLREFDRRGALRVPQHVLGLTAYPESAASSGPEFQANGWTIVEWSERDDWEIVVGRKVLHIVEAKRGSTDSDHVIDLAIVTALHRIELESVLDLDANWQKAHHQGDDTIYHEGTFTGGSKGVRVVAVAAPEMGMAAAAALSMKVIHRYKPRYLAMCGIAAGIKAQFGDILVADRVWDYGSGKMKETFWGAPKFVSAPSQIPLDPLVKAKLNLFCMRREIANAIRAGWKDDRVPETLRIVIGPIASGAAVVASAKARTGIEAQNGKIVGLEMEAYGVFMAAELAPAPRPMPMVVKSVCDFADKDKTDDYQRYAAYTSARFVYEFAIDSIVR